MRTLELLKNPKYSARVSLGNNLWYFYDDTRNLWVVCEYRKYARKPVTEDFETEESAVEYVCQRYDKK